MTMKKALLCLKKNRDRKLELLPILYPCLMYFFLGDFVLIITSIQHFDFYSLYIFYVQAGSRLVGGKFCSSFFTPSIKFDTLFLLYV